MFIKNGDGKILSIIKSEEELSQEASEKLVKDTKEKLKKVPAVSVAVVEKNKKLEN